MTRPTRPFQPAILHTTTLSVLLVLTLVVLGLVEYACHVLPHTKDGSFRDTLNDIRDAVHPRHEPQFTILPRTIWTRDVSNTVITTIHRVVITEVRIGEIKHARIQARQTPAPSLDTYSITNGTRMSSAPGKLTIHYDAYPKWTGSSLPAEAPSAPPPSAYLQTDPPPSISATATPPLAPPPGAYLHTDPPPSILVSLAPPLSAYSQKHPPASTSALELNLVQDKDNYLQTNRPSSTLAPSSTPASSTPPLAPPPGAYLPTNPPASIPAPSAPPPSAYAQTNMFLPLPSAPPPSVYFQKNLPLSSLITPAPSSNVSFQTEQSLSLLSSSLPSNVSFGTDPPSTPTLRGYHRPKPTPTNTGYPDLGRVFEQKGYISNGGDYFVGAYLPTLLAIVFALPWPIIDRNIRSLEPFYQLSKPWGASAESALTVNFHATAALFRLLYHKQWTVVMSSALTGLSVLITPLASEAIFVHLNDECSATTVGCTGSLGISIAVARTIEGILAAMSVLILLLLVSLKGKKIKSVSDPRSIAGLAILFLSSEVRSDFLQLQTLPTEEELRSVLRGNAYKLDMMASRDGFTSIGLVKIIDGHAPSEMLSAVNHEYSPLQWDRKFKSAYRLSASCLFVFLLALASLILAYYYTSGDNGFEKFMDSQGFGVKFTFTLVGVMISLYWRMIFQEMALLAPYRHLVSGNATAQESIIVTPPQHPLLAINSAFYAHHYVLVLTAVAATLSEVLTIALSTIPFSGANLWEAYVISTWLCIGIIIIMLLTLSLLLFYKEPELPVKPATIAAQLVYLCDSTLPSVFKDMVTLDTKTMRQRIVACGYRYKLDVCQDGVDKARLTVDFE